MVKKRGDEYEGIKKTLGHQMIEQACRLYPQIREDGDLSESVSAQSVFSLSITLNILKLGHSDFFDISVPEFSLKF